MLCNTGNSYTIKFTFSQIYINKTMILNWILIRMQGTSSLHTAVPKKVWKFITKQKKIKRLIFCNTDNAYRKVTFFSNLLIISMIPN